VSQVAILVAAAAYFIAALDFARRGQWLLFGGWFTSAVSIFIWSFVKEAK
jgi:hypothetical protein